MGFFDFLTNASADPMGYAGPQNTADAFLNTSGGGGFDFGAMMKDPNILKAMASMGTALDPEGAGGTIGRPASALITNKALQQATAKRTGQQNALLDKILGAIGKGGMVSDVSDNSLPDNLTLSLGPKGETSMTLKGTPTENAFSDVTDLSLDSVRKPAPTPSTGGGGFPF